MKLENLEAAIKAAVEWRRLVSARNTAEICYFNGWTLSDGKHSITVRANEAAALIQPQIDAIEARLTELGVTVFE